MCTTRRTRAADYPAASGAQSQLTSPTTIAYRASGRLDARGVQHDAARAGDRARRQVLAELGAHHAVVAVRPAHLAPDHAELGVVDLLLRLVDVRDALAEVEICVRALVDVLNLDKGRVLVLV